MSLDHITVNFQEMKFGSMNWMELVHDQIHL
jgi:hypothetical protein